MNIEDCFYLGYVQKTIGTKGELALKLDVDSPSSYTNMKMLLVQEHASNKQGIPFFLTQSQLTNQGTIRCALEGIEDQSSAKKLVGKSLFLPIEQLPELKGNQFYFHEITGFKVNDRQHGWVGMVKEVLSYSNSNLLSIEFKEKEILVPISDNSILKLDREKKEIYINSPEGLINIYLE